MTEDLNEDFFKEEPLNPDLLPFIQKSKIGDTLHHPLLIQPFYSPGLNYICNRQYEQKTKFINDAIKNKNWDSYIWMHERPYRLEKFVEIIDELSDEQYWKMLGEIWSDSENLWQYKIILDFLLSQDKSNRQAMMDEEEKEFLEKLPEEFIVYRGHQGKNKLGHSWTLSYWKAKWFASRFNQKCAVAQTIISKKDIIAVLLGRGEFEIVISPKNIKDINTVSKIRRPDWIEKIFDEVKKFSKKHSYHGLWHWEKVEKNALILAAKTPGADKIVAQLFAILHDSQRENEDFDPEHGHRAAEFAKKLYDEGKLKITSKQCDILRAACGLHNQGKITDIPTIGVCWDADRLDLTRVGIIPDKELFSTQAAKDLLWKI